MAVTSVCIRTSIPAARCCSGVRAMSSASVSTAPLIQYGMPQALYDVARPFSNATMLSSSGPTRLRAWLAALMPAASPPMTTRRRLMAGP